MVVQAEAATRASKEEEDEWATKEWCGPKANVACAREEKRGGVRRGEKTGVKMSKMTNN